MKQLKQLLSLVLVLLLFAAAVSGCKCTSGKKDEESASNDVQESTEESISLDENELPIVTPVTESTEETTESTDKPETESTSAPDEKFTPETKEEGNTNETTVVPSTEPDAPTQAPSTEEKELELPIIPF